MISWRAARWRLVGMSLIVLVACAQDDSDQQVKPWLHYVLTPRAGGDWPQISLFSDGSARRPLRGLGNPPGWSSYLDGVWSLRAGELRIHFDEKVSEPALIPPRDPNELPVRDAVEYIQVLRGSWRNGYRTTSSTLTADRTDWVVRVLPPGTVFAR